MFFERDNFKKAKGVWLKDYEGKMNTTALFKTVVPKGKILFYILQGKAPIRFL